jgi:hypothetical protein
MHERDTDALLAMLADLETFFHSKEWKDVFKEHNRITSKVDPVPPPVKLAALPGPTTPVVHEPVPALSSVIV